MLLFIWVFGTFIFYCYLNWTTSARNILPILPAASILVIRRINFYLKEPQTFFRSQFLWPLLPAVFISFLVAYADASWANSQRSAAQTINQKFADHKSDVMFQGHWGFQYYMESLGYKPKTASPATAEIEVSMNVPAKVNASDEYIPDLSYAGIMSSNSVVSSTSGVDFTMLDDVNFKVSSSLDPLVKEALEPSSGNVPTEFKLTKKALVKSCLLYTSDAADE